VSDDPTPRTRDGRDVARLTVAIVVIAAFIALAALAIAADGSTLSLGAPAKADPSTDSTDAPPAEEALLGLVTAPAPTTAPAVAPAPTAAPASEPTPTEELLPPLAPPPEGPAGKPCEAFSLPAPQQVGGLQNLVRLIPLFGPFSPEAFAMLPAFQPGMDALGPLFPLFEQGLDAAAPVLDPLTVVVAQLSDAGFQALAPLYGPYRQSVLDGEAQLAAFLQPIVEQLATAPGSECLIALEGVLAELAP
jgi:hypothetical protein